VTGPRLTAGWLTVPFTGDELGRIDIGVGTPPAWTAAFLDWDDGQRIAQIRTPAGFRNQITAVWLRKGTQVEQAGNLRLP
jgi:hypothetical protein